MTRPPVVVVGLDCPTGLQAARVYAARGVRVIGVAADPGHPCARTRSCISVVRADPHPDGLLATLLDLGARLDERAVLLPCTDQAVLCASRHRGALIERYHLAVPPPETIELLLDKARFAEFAMEQGLPIPTTFVIRNLGDARAAASQIAYPCVLKPSFKTVEWTRYAPAKAVLAHSPSELVGAYERHARWADAFVVQEWIAGDDGAHYTCDCYVNAAGVPLVTFTSRKIRQWPPVVGQGCLSVEERNPDVRAQTLRVMRAAGHHGPGYLEMKYDERLGHPVILEANVGRPTGRSTCAEKAGVEMLMTMYCDLIGAPLPTQRTQTFGGTKWIHIRRDVMACAHLWLSGRARIRDILRSWQGTFAFALFSVRDPLPFLADCIRALLDAFEHPSRLRRSMPRARAHLGVEAPSTARSPAERIRVPTLARAEVVDFEVPGALRVRTLDASASDLAAVARDVGAAATTPGGSPDVVISFVDDLSPTQLRLIDGGKTAYGDGGVYFLDSVGGSPVAFVRPGAKWGRGLIVCRRGVARVPSLALAADLVALSRGWVPLHASAWTRQGVGVLVAGWAGSGKTGALLAACERGAVPLGDDRILLSGDGGSMVGLGRPITLRDWHLAQVQLPRAEVGTVLRTLSKVAPALDGLAERLAGADGMRIAPWTRPIRRAFGRARRGLETEVAPSCLPGWRAMGECVRPDVLILLETQRHRAMSHARIDAGTASRRLAAEVEAELMAGLRAHLSFRYALPERTWEGVRHAPAVAARLVYEATRGRAAYLIRHPHPCSLGDLHDVMENVLRDAASSARSRRAVGARQRVDQPVQVVAPA